MVAVRRIEQHDVEWSKWFMRFFGVRGVCSVLKTRRMIAQPLGMSQCSRFSAISALRAAIALDECDVARAAAERLDADRARARVAVEHTRAADRAARAR